MSEHKTIDELLEIVDPHESMIGRKIFHLRTTSYYVVTGLLFRESDMKLMFSYRTMHHRPVSFARPIEEMVDGRFKILSARGDKT